MNRIVTKPTRIDLHIHSAASTATKDKGKKELADCDKGHVDVLLRALEHMASTCAQLPTTIASTKTSTSL